MIKVHHLNNSRSQRILWILEELHLDYQIVHYQRDPKTMLAPENLGKIHPLGKSPVIIDEQFDPNQPLAESGAIIDYLAHNYGKQSLIPKANSKEFIQYNYWLHFSEGSLMPPFLLKLIFDKIKTSPMPFFIRPIAKGIANKVMTNFISPNIKRNLAFVEQHLAKNNWFAGEHFSAADIQMSFPLEAAVARQLVDGKHPMITAYVNTIKQRPAYIKALAKGGPYDY